MRIGRLESAPATTPASDSCSAIMSMRDCIHEVERWCANASRITGDWETRTRHRTAESRSRQQEQHASLICERYLELEMTQAH